MLWPLWLSEGLVPSSTVVEHWRHARRLSLKQLLAVSTQETEFQWRQTLEERIGRLIVEDAQRTAITPATATAELFIQRPRQLPSPAAGAAARARPRRVHVQAPARVDLSGGWTDTPPISYEHGGAVTNLAVRVNGQLPISAVAEVLPSSEPFHILLSTGEREPDLRVDEPAQLLDLRDPSAPGALLKAAIVFSGIAALPGSEGNGDGEVALSAQLAASVGGTLRLASRSELPQGSGLGTSSILAGALLQALAPLTGHHWDDESLVHAVLQLEQMITTGGGWQDQTGGTFPGGAKIARSPAQLPLHVTTSVVTLPQDFAHALSARLALVFTGKPRLAKNLLVEVIRRWWSGSPEVATTTDQLVAAAEACAVALAEGDLPRVGECLSRYHALKRVMAGPGYEPPGLEELLQRAKPLIWGGCMCGAGGGGFLAVLSREPLEEQAHWDALQRAVGDELVLQRGTLHEEGLVVTVTTGGEGSLE